MVILSASRRNFARVFEIGLGSLSSSFGRVVQAVDLG